MMEKAFMEFYHSDSKEYGYNYKDNYFHPIWMRKAEKRKLVESHEISETIHEGQ